MFISYSHRDEDLKQELEDHLALLKRQDKICPWQDRQIEAGTEWNEQIRAALDEADIILLLVSPRFMNSDFCYGKEMQRAMQRHQNGDARVIPIILTPTDWKGAAFDRLQMLPKNSKPVVDWPNHDAAFVDVVKGIRRAVESLAPSSDKTDNGWAIPPQIKSALGSSSQADRSASTRDRMQLFTALSSLPGPQFSQLVFTLNPPSGNVLPDSASQANREQICCNGPTAPLGRAWLRWMIC
ncbi:MAG: toll/interleukin-1 receptor domain-containing protein [Nodosilinea sp.]